MSIDPVPVESTPPLNGEGVPEPAPASSPVAPAPAAPSAQLLPPQRSATGRPWVTVLAIAACIGVFLGLNNQRQPISWEALSKFGVLPADQIWEGSYWGLVCSAFAHIELWHLAFNVYWLWVFGAPLERAIGSLRYLAFYLAAAAVSSSYQLAFSDTTGIGASGVGYALFGFLWWGRHTSPEFEAALSGRTVQYFLLWLVGCMVATQLDLWNVGNAAHFSGMLFGIAVAAAFVVPGSARVGKIGIAGLVSLAIVPLFWAPWSASWLGHQAYQAHAAKRYDDAYDYYSRFIERVPDSAWAHLNRSYVNQALGEPERARADRQTALAIDPAIERKE